jgi:hypothetical protein
MEVTGKFLEGLGIFIGSVAMLIKVLTNLRKK